MDIGTLFRKYNSDKDADLGHGHSYGPVYQSLFGSRRLEIKSVLEIGVLGGASIRAWEEFFPNARIVGLDINTVPKKDGRVEIYRCDATKWDEIPEEVRNSSWDVVIEDGSHWFEHQKSTYDLFWPKVKPNGVLVVEDIQNNESHTKFEEMGGTIYDLRAAGRSFDNVLCVWIKPPEPF